MVLFLEPKHTLEAPDEDESEAELSDNEIEMKRESMRKKVLHRRVEEEYMMKEEEKKSDSEDAESSEYEEYTDSEEDTGISHFICISFT